jgi:hypothetical protein
MDAQTPLVVSVPASAGTASGLVTEDKRPVILHAIEPIVLVLVRASKTFIDTLLASTAITQVAPAVFDAHSFGASVKIAAAVAAVAAGVTALRTIGELLTKWDQSHPTLAA